MRLQDFFKEAQLRDWKVTLYQFSRREPYRDVFWRIKETGENNIVLDVKPEHIHRVLKHVSYVSYVIKRRHDIHRVSY